VRGPVALAVAAALTVAATACGGSGGDKAGGRHPEARNPLVLTLAVHDPSWGAAEFADAVEKRSGGSIVIDAETTPWMNSIDWEQRTVEEVRSGRVDLGIVGARVWDTLGVRSFQALLTPFLVDSLELERRVLEGPLAVRMLVRLEDAGVVGIALLPGPLRRPFGHANALVSVSDYKGRTIGVVPGEVERATFRALGASTRAYLSLHPSFFAGAALDPWAITEGGYEGKSLVTNVALWPRAETIVMNASAFGELASTQRRALLEAGRAAVEPRIRRIKSSEQEAVRAICSRDLVSLVTASPADVHSLRDAVRPVYAELERNGETQDLITEIRSSRAGAHTEPLYCPAPEISVASEPEGRWQATPTRAELLAAGASPREVPSGLSGLEIEFADGQWVADGLNTRRQWRGTYTVNGDVIRLTIETCSHNPCTPGAAAEHGWSVYRGVLSLAALPGRSSWPLVTANPFRQIR
jgi:TRAP-type C4-dicarboxylate transport system substrate-binding protein